MGLGNKVQGSGCHRSPLPRKMACVRGRWSWGQDAKGRVGSTRYSLKMRCYLFTMHPAFEGAEVVAGAIFMSDLSRTETIPIGRLTPRGEKKVPYFSTRSALFVCGVSGASVIVRSA